MKLPKYAYFQRSNRSVRRGAPGRPHARLELRHRMLRGPARPLERRGAGALRLPAGGPLPSVPRFDAAPHHAVPDTAQELVGHLLELLRAEELRTDCYIRPLAFYADETIGVRLHDLTPAISMVAFPFGKYFDNDESGAHVTISSWKRINDNMIPPRGKIAGSYVNSALARSDAQRAGFDDAVTLNKDGHISEGSVANIFLVRHGEVITPPVTDDILEGITRLTFMTLMKEELGITPSSVRSIAPSWAWRKRRSSWAPGRRSSRSRAWTTGRSEGPARQTDHAASRSLLRGRSREEAEVPFLVRARLRSRRPGGRLTRPGLRMTGPPTN